MVASLRDYWNDGVLLCLGPMDQQGVRVGGGKGGGSCHSLRLVIVPILSEIGDTCI